MRRLAIVAVVVLLTVPAVPAAPPPGKAVSVTYGSGEWDSGEKCFPFAMYDPVQKSYKMYYSASMRAEANESMWNQRSTGALTSADGNSWQLAGEPRQPVLAPRKLYEGDILSPDQTSAVFDSVHAIGVCVIRNGPLYKMWYTGWNGDTELAPGKSDGSCNKVNCRIGYATSPDGAKWTKQDGSAGAGSALGLGPKGSPDAKGVGQPCVLKEGDTFHMWYEGFDGKAWRIFYAVSNNGTRWAKRGVALDLGGRGAPDETGLRNPVIVKRGDGYELWYQGRGASAPNYRVLRATSGDGIRWTKAPGEVTLHPPTPAAGDEEIYVDSILVQPDGSCQVFFSKQDIVPPSGWVPSETRRFSNYTEVVKP